MVDAVSGQWVGLTPYLTAWVTPIAPAVMQVLNPAAGLHPDKAISGYQVNKAGVETQVQHIYQALIRKTKKGQRLESSCCS